MAKERGLSTSSGKPLSDVVLGEEANLAPMDEELAAAIMADVAGLSTEWDEESGDFVGVTIDESGVPIRIPMGVFGEDEEQNRNLEKELGKAHIESLKRAWEEKRRKDIKAGKYYEQ